MARNKKDLSEYITTIQSTKPSAEVKFKTTSDDGTTEEVIASKTYVAEHAENEINAVNEITELAARMSKLTDKNNSITESEVVFAPAEEEVEQASPLTHAPNNEPQPTIDLSETALLISLLTKLVDKIDQMQNFNPVIHVPAPVIHVTLPETKRTVTKAIERDENNWIKTVREHIEEAPDGEPLIEVKKPKKTIKKKDIK